MSATTKFSYRQRLLHVLGVIFLLGPTAIFLGYLAMTDHRRLLINGILELSPSAANIFYWAACAFSSGVTLLGLYMLAFRFLRTCFVQVTENELVVPQGPFSTREVGIPFSDIQALQLLKIQRHSVLSVIHGRGKVTLPSTMFATDAAFQDLCALLTSKVRAVCRPNG